MDLNEVLAGSDCVLYSKCHFNSSPPTDAAHHYNEGKGSSKKVRKLVTEKSFSSKRKKDLQGWLNASLNSMETMDELSTTCNLVVL